VPVAGDVPNRFDCIINGQGYVFADSVEPSVPFRTHRAIYGYSPTFLDRTNVGDAYGDNKQDFWLTAEQHDWDLGEQQRFFRAADPARSRRYWQGDNIDVTTVSGQASTRNAMTSASFAGAVRATSAGATNVYTVSSTNLYSISNAGSITDHGAHGLGTTPGQWGLATDGLNFYIAGAAGGGSNVRKYNGSTFSTFSGSGADSLCYLNNTLFGYSTATGAFHRYDTSGVKTTIYTWQDAAGNALTGSAFAARLVDLGANVLILRVGTHQPGEIWKYDGTATTKVADFPSAFTPQDITVVNGVAMVPGYLTIGTSKLPAIYYYVNSSTGLLWRANLTNWTNATWPAVAPWGEGLAFTDDTTQNLMQYNMATGGVHSIGSYTATNATPMMSANKNLLLHTRNATTAYWFPNSSLATTSVVMSSLFDFDNSLPKLFRGVKVDYTVTSNATVDLAYQIDGLDGAYTSLQTSAVSGTEYIVGQTGHSISIKVTMNTGSATVPPILKRLYIRAAPQLQAFPKGEYLLDLGGSLSKGVRRLRDGTPHPKTGYQQALDLITAANVQGTISITDRLNGTYTGVIDPGQLEIYEERPAPSGTESGIFLAKVVCRGV
jgi:hypothetical protein